MDVTNPAAVLSQIGAIEDALAIAQNNHADTKGLEFSLSNQVKLVAAGLRPDITGANKDERDAKLEELIQGSEAWQEWATAKEQLIKHQVRLEYLDKRLSACQSVLKQFQHDANPNRYGQSRGQDRQRQPDG